MRGKLKQTEYIDVETGDSIHATGERFLDPKRFRRLDESGALLGVNKGEEKGLTVKNAEDHRKNDKAGYYREIGGLGRWWRWWTKLLIKLENDDVNALRITRGMQLSLPFLSAYESYVLAHVIQAFDSGNKDDLKYALDVAFANRNVSRTIVQQGLARWDFIFHQDSQHKSNRWYDGIAKVPILGIITGRIWGFPATENFPDARGFFLGSVLRILLGRGLWFTRFLTGREALITDNRNVTAQNLAAESNGFEAANRNQHGTYQGRALTNWFRESHRLPTDESIVRTFVASPGSTMTNNGVEHVLGQVARHWHNMIYQPYGNFAHQRMEQLNPFEALRFHMPVVLTVLANLRGISFWDRDVLGPFMTKLQLIKPVDNVEPILALVKELQESIVVPVCAGIASRVDRLRSWLDAIKDALNLIEQEAKVISKKVHDVAVGLQLGDVLISSTEWKVPKDKEITQAVHDVCMDHEPKNICKHAVKRALYLLSPKDKRTLIELVRNGHKKSRPAKLLTQRTVVLCQRELRRDSMDAALRQMSKGNEVHLADCKQDRVYWLLEAGGKETCYVYTGKKSDRNEYRFIDRLTRDARFVKEDQHVRVLEYIAIAEAIIKAQKLFMYIELDHGRKFSYDAFMEFNFLREGLQQLLVLSQVFCPELDDARLNVLQSIQKSAHTTVTVNDLEPGAKYYVYVADDEAEGGIHGKNYKAFTCKKKYDPNNPDDPYFEKLKTKKIVTVRPQSVIVIGGGPTGLITTLHCLENVLLSDGKMRLYESRDAFLQAGATFERSQIVRLDARWIAMLRYHLGTIFEDVFIPATGETDPHYGNTLPSQGFIEITIKDMESMMHVQVSKLLSRGLLQHDTNAGAQYSIETNTLTKKGAALKENDNVHRKFDPSGRACTETYIWKVAELVYNKPLPESAMELGKEYLIYVGKLKKSFPYRCTGIKLQLRQYSFVPVGDAHPEAEPIETDSYHFPTIFPMGTVMEDRCKAIVFECTIRSPGGYYTRESINFSDVEKESFVIDVGQCHVAEAIGKPLGSPVHFAITTSEPYGVACLSGLKVSMGMHNFGTRRWKYGIQDDVRSVNDQNTRVIGDFTKTVNSSVITKNMLKFLKKDPNWRLHFEKLIADNVGSGLLANVFDLMVGHVEGLVAMAPYERSHLQTRFFETGDNFYLGMEFTREYDKWKNSTVEKLVMSIKSSVDEKKSKALTGILLHHIDRLWYDACLETIRKGDVYNPGGQKRVPRLYLIDSQIDTTLGKLDVGESFRLSDDMKERYEVLVVKFKCGGCCKCKCCRDSAVVVRSVEGQVSTMSAKTKVRRGGNLTRAPDGNTESKVSIATFPVAHYVNHRTVRTNSSDRGYVFAFLGDEQSTPHFMRYSGLTGACINSMLLNNFIATAIDGHPFSTCIRNYSAETNWSNGEVVTRGTGANYGQDGFLRPGFQYEYGINYLHSKVHEYRETRQDMDVVSVLSRDWKIKFAASFIPRGMEFNRDYLDALREQIEKTVLHKFIADVEKDKELNGKVDDVGTVLRMRARSLNNGDRDPDTYWHDFIKNLNIPEEQRAHVANQHGFAAEQLGIMLQEIIEQAQNDAKNNLRISTQGYNQPRSVDSWIDDFAVEAQNTASGLATSATFAAAALAAQFVTTIGSAILSGVTPFLAVGTITRTSSYKNRNEEWRVQFADTKYLYILRNVFCCMAKKERDAVPVKSNPFVMILDHKKRKFEYQIGYYNCPEPTEFMAAYETLLANLHNTSAIVRFMKTITTELLPDTYHVNSYLQETLVDIYTTAEELLRLESEHDRITPEQSEAALALFERLPLFEARLQKTLKRGAIRFGFLKFDKEDVKNRRLPDILSWCINRIWPTRTGKTGCLAIPKTVQASRAASSGCKPILAETQEIAAQIKYVSEKFDHPVLKRDIQDCKTLASATKESYTSSLVIVSAWLSYITGYVFTIGNIIDLISSNKVSRALLTGGSYSFGLITPITAVLAAYYLFRQLLLLFSVDRKLGSKIKTSASDKDCLKHVRRITRTQELVVAMRVVASSAAAIALPWALAAREGWWSVLSQDPPLYVALGSLGLQVLSIILLFIIEYSVRYNLSNKLGEYICTAFEPELHQLEHELSVPRKETETEAVHERALWEYVATAFSHKYRFDAVFAADRFGSIFQYIQSGLNRR